MAIKSLTRIFRRPKPAPAKPTDDDGTTPQLSRTELQERHSGPSPNPSTNQLLADLALQGGSLLLRRSVERSILGMTDGKKPDAKNAVKRTVGQTILGAAVAKLATKSVPGAIVVAGGLLALTLHERRKAKLAKQEDKTAEDELAEDGKAAES